MCLLISNSCSTSSVDTFTPSPPTIQLSRLAVDSHSGTVYIGAVNHVYQLDSNLTLVVDVSTGPVQDDINCLEFNATGHLNCNPLQTSLTDNYNQVYDYLLNDLTCLSWTSIRLWWVSVNWPSSHVVKPASFS